MEKLKAKLTKIDRYSEAIILLHGLLRSGRSMEKAGKLLGDYGYQIINVEYPSRKYEIQSLAVNYIDQALAECDPVQVQKIHFLTHSLGGIMIRYYLTVKPIEKLGKVVMLAPPNQGSEIVDKLGTLNLFKYLNGPAGLQLGTGSRSLPNSLGPVNFQAGIIAGDKSINPFLSQLIPGDNDGKVSVNRSRVEGMQDFIVLPYSHTFIMQRSYVIYQSLYFIQQGSFFQDKNTQSGLSAPISS